MKVSSLRLLLPIFLWVTARVVGRARAWEKFLSLLCSVLRPKLYVGVARRS
jgi:hypothetical protein